LDAICVCHNAPFKVPPLICCCPPLCQHMPF
jgi:hypothetical protein